MKPTGALQPGHYYHIYNRGNNREDLFREERNYRYFLGLYARHISPIAETFAYCLMRNHFHLLLRIREAPQVVGSSTSGGAFMPSRCFSNLFNAYAKGINKAYGRTGSLFEERFGRIEVTSEAYFANLIFYIHFNPQKHGFVNDFRLWPWSSYSALYGTGATMLARDAVMARFGDRTAFDEFHRGMVDERALAMLINEDLA